MHFSVTAADDRMQQCLEQGLQVCQMWWAQFLFPTPCVFLRLSRGSSQGSTARVTKRTGIIVDTRCRRCLCRVPSDLLHVVQITYLSLQHYLCYLEIHLPFDLNSILSVVSTSYSQGNVGEWGRPGNLRELETVAEDGLWSRCSPGET